MVMKTTYFPLLILFKMFFQLKRYNIFGISVEISKEASCYGDYEMKKLKSTANLYK